MVDYVHLDVGVRSQIGDGPGRSDVGENQMVVVQDANSPLGREVRRAVGADRGDESEPLSLYQFLHLVSQLRHLYSFAAHSRQVSVSPPLPKSTLPGKTFSRQGSSRMAANASDLGLSHPGTIFGSYPTGSGPLRKRFHTMTRVSSSKAHVARHSATQVS